MRGRRFLVMSICLGAMILGLSGVLVAQETVKITHWSFSEPVMTHFWETVIRDFSVEYPDLKLKKVEMPHGLYWDQILVLMTAGPAPDVTGTVPIQVKQWAAMEAIEPLDPWMELDEIKRTFLPQQRTFCVGEDGKTYAVTQGARPLIMIYNEKLFAEAGIPEAPAFPPEFVAAAMKMTIPGKEQYGLWY